MQSTPKRHYLREKSLHPYHEQGLIGYVIISMWNDKLAISNLHAMLVLVA